MECGRTVTPCPHTHCTRMTLTLVGRPLRPLSTFFPHDCTLSRTPLFSLKNALFPHTPIGLPHHPSSHRRRCSIPHAEDSLCFGSGNKKGNDFWAVITFFCWGNLADGVGCMLFAYILGCCSFLRFLVGCCFPTFVG